MTPVDPDYGHHASRIHPEELLIFSILSRAVTDLFGSVSLASNLEETQQAKHEALTFLTQESGGWEKRRRDLCDAVGIDSGEMRDRVVRVLEGDLVALDTYETRGALTDVENARALWAHEKGVAERAHQVRMRAKTLRPKPRKPAPKRNSITKYSEVRPIVMGLLERPHSFKDLLIATGGDVSDSTIRDVLRNGLIKGELVKPHNNTYLLASVPETAVAAAA